MKFIVLDVETTGFPVKLGWDKYYPPDHLKMYDPARVVSIAWAIVDSDTESQLVAKYYVIKAGDFKIDDKSVATSIHGITHAISARGTTMKVVLEDLYADIQDCELFVAHNANFDLSVMQSEAYRHGHALLSCMVHLNTGKEYTGVLNEIPFYCTMQYGKYITRIPYKGMWKYPKLVELYKYLYGESFDSHNALADVIAASKCYILMRKRKIIL